MKPHRPSFYAISTGFGLGLVAALWWSLSPGGRSPALSEARQNSPVAPTASVSRDGSENADLKRADTAADVTVKRIRELLATLEPVLPGETENKSALELLHWWAEIDPAGAITYAHDHPAIHGRAHLASELLTAWLDARGELVLNWANALPPGNLRSQLWPAVIAFVAETRPLEALPMVAELDGDNRRMALSALFAAWSSVDPARAAAEAQRLPTAEEQNLALRQVIEKWADRDLDASIAWVKRLPPRSDPGSLDVEVSPLEILLEKWTAQAPMDAVRYLAALPEGTRRIQMLSTAAGQWGEHNPSAALGWAASLPDEADRSVALRGVLAGVAQSDASRAADLALTLPAGPEQRQGMELVIDQWSARAPDALMRWATAHVSDSSLPTVMPAIVTAWAGADLATLGDWLNALPAGAARDSCCAALARHLAPTQPQLAREWAASIADPRLRQQQVNDIALVPR